MDTHLFVLQLGRHDSFLIRIVSGFCTASFNNSALALFSRSGQWQKINFLGEEIEQKTLSSRHLIFNIFTF